MGGDITSIAGIFKSLARTGPHIQVHSEDLI